MNEGVTEDDINKFRTRLTRIGDCVVVVGDFSLVKVHVHTNDPGKAIQYACELGELVNMKIDNMAEAVSYTHLTAQEIADALNKQYGVKVEKRKIDVANIRNAGDFTVNVWLYAGITAEMTAKVEIG